ncbi:uncharacterized protein LOC117175438 [Belonocnema kinseyi]|uniref:uncharacterized protein LOC117175438 n=1 Tax=Belonocnema kinseyi TaxID=2817044 RepID=UPI00143D8993|nr:uncharacterized protein LOC117175438 [Belonocnema kinseyi]
MTNFKDLTNDELAVELPKVIDPEVVAILKDVRKSVHKPQLPGKESEDSAECSAIFVRQNYPGYCESAKEAWDASWNAVNYNPGPSTSANPDSRIDRWELMEL